MTSTADQDRILFEQYRGELAVRIIPAAALCIVAGVVLYGVSEWFLRPATFSRFLPIYLAEVGILLLALIVHRRLPITKVPYLLFAVDFTFTCMLIGSLVHPDTSVSAIALVLCLKMLVPPLILPWTPLFQAVAVVLALVPYFAVFAFGWRNLPSDGSPHPLIGPAVAAVFSVAGAFIAERMRIALFERGARLFQAEQQLRFLIRRSPIALWMTDRELRVTVALGGANLPKTTDAVQIVGRRLPELFATLNPQLPPLKAHLDALQGHSSSYEVPWEERYYVAHVGPWHTVQGDIGGVIGVVWDITDRKQAEALQAREVEVARALARAGEVLLGSRDVTETLQRLCHLTRELLGTEFCLGYLWNPERALFELVAASGLAEDTVEELAAFPARPSELGTLYRALQEQEVFRIQISHLSEHPWAKLGRRFDMTELLNIGIRPRGELRAVLCTGARGKPLAIDPARERIAAGVAHLGALAFENARLLEDLEQASRVKSEFVATMSHELRTPLNVIIGYASLLVDESFGPMNQEQQDVLRRLLASAQQLLDLITTTLDFSRLEAKQISVKQEPTDVVILLRQIEEEVRGAWNKPGVELQFDVPATLPTMHSDPVKIAVILKNLIGNAIKFTERGQVVVRAVAREHGIEFVVSDTGVGIPPSALPHIFEPFWQADSSPTREHGGVGLGLYIVRRLTELLGGQVTVSSQLGHGSTFRVWFPLRPPAAQPGHEAPAKSTPLAAVHP